jgi:hypothetical protein
MSAKVNRPGVYPRTTTLIAEARPSEALLAARSSEALLAARSSEALLASTFQRGLCWIANKTIILWGA